MRGGSCCAGGLLGFQMLPLERLMGRGLCAVGHVGSGDVRPAAERGRWRSVGVVTCGAANNARLAILLAVKACETAATHVGSRGRARAGGEGQRGATQCRAHAAAAAVGQ